MKQKRKSEFVVLKPLYVRSIPLKYICALADAFVCSEVGVEI